MFSFIPSTLYSHSNFIFFIFFLSFTLSLLLFFSFFISFFLYTVHHTTTSIFFSNIFLSFYFFFSLHLLFPFLTFSFTKNSGNERESFLYFFFILFFDSSSMQDHILRLLFYVVPFSSSFLTLYTLVPLPFYFLHFLLIAHLGFPCPQTSSKVEFILQYNDKSRDHLTFCRFTSLCPVLDNTFPPPLCCKVCISSSLHMMNFSFFYFFLCVFFTLYLYFFTHNQQYFFLTYFLNLFHSSSCTFSFSLTISTTVLLHLFALVPFHCTALLSYCTVHLLLIVTHLFAYLLTCYVIHLNPIQYTVHIHNQTLFIYTYTIIAVLYLLPYNEIFFFYIHFFC